MDTDYWHTKWAKNDIGFHLNKPNPNLVKHHAHIEHIGPTRVFVPLCGKTKDVGWLLQAGHQVVGVELSEAAVQALFNDLSLTPDKHENESPIRYSAENIDIFVGDIFGLTLSQLGHVDAVFDRAALVALPPEMRIRYAQHVASITEGVKQLLVTFDYDQTTMAGPPHSVPESEVLDLYSKRFHIELIDKHPIENGLKGKVPADELIWVLSPL